jgi:tripartite-type tricarboxylate transporter receptor subunit TctC
MPSRPISVLAATSVALALGSLLPASAQENPESYFRGKNVTVIIPTGPGGDRMTYALSFMRYFGRHIPGNPNVVASFMPGAGGAVGMNYLQNVAAPNGLTIATPLTPVVMAQMTGEKTVKYDVAKMHWIGRTADATQVLYVRGNSGVNDVNDLKSRKVMIGSSGVAGVSAVVPYVMNEVLGTKMHLVFGYSGSGAFNLAVQRGETDGAVTTWTNLKNNYGELLANGTLRMVVQVGLMQNPDLPKVPLAIDLAGNEADRAALEFMSSASEMGQTFVAPTGVPPQIVATLRRAFDATVKDPEYLASMEKARNVVNPMTGEELTKMVARTLATPSNVVDRYKVAIAPPR